MVVDPSTASPSTTPVKLARRRNDTNMDDDDDDVAEYLFFILLSWYESRDCSSVVDVGLNRTRHGFVVIDMDVWYTWKIRSSLRLMSRIF